MASSISASDLGQAVRNAARGFFQTNSVGTALLYELIVTERPPIQRIVVVSSQAIYGEGRYHCAVYDVQYPGPRGREQLEARRWEVV